MKLGRLRLRDPRGAQDELTLAARSYASSPNWSLDHHPRRRRCCHCGKPPLAMERPHERLQEIASDRLNSLMADFCNKIDMIRKRRHGPPTSAIGGIPENICAA